MSQIWNFERKGGFLKKDSILGPAGAIVVKAAGSHMVNCAV